MWSVGDSIELARKYVAGMGDRWTHLSTVGRTAEALAARSDLVGEDIVSAAWLHDIGYSAELAASGFHPLDGARFLQSVGVPTRVVALVGHHTGAAYEAEERGLLNGWRELPSPDAAALDVLTMVDLATGPAGQSELDVDRIAWILSRYSEDNPVHRAVTKSRDALLASSARGKALLGLPDEWPAVSGQGVGDAESHRGMQL